MSNVPLSRRLFDKYDTDHSGSIDAFEFQELCYDRGYFLSDEEMEVALTIVDSDGSGRISYKEFLKFWQDDKRFEHLHLSEKQQEKVHATATFFRYFDKDVSGALDKREFENLHSELLQQGYVLGPVGELMAEIDSGHDGTVNFNEFLNWMLKMGMLSVSDDDEGYGTAVRKATLVQVKKAKQTGGQVPSKVKPRESKAKPAAAPVASSSSSSKGAEDTRRYTVDGSAPPKGCCALM